MVAAPEGIGLDDADLDDKVQLPGPPIGRFWATDVRQHRARPGAASHSMAPAEKFSAPDPHCMVAAKTDSSGAPECDCSRTAWLIPVLLCIFF